jgi:uncharacterized membrane protein HdeD (DUF308 family)
MQWGGDCRTGSPVKEVLMLAVLAADWSLVFVRASLALLFGIAALAWPALTPITLAVLFGVYALLDGVVALIVAFHAKGLPGFGSFLFEGLVRLGASAIALAISDRVALVLPTFFAAWAGLSGIGELAAAVVLRKEMTGEWPLPTAGILSLFVAVLLIARPGMGLPALVWLLGPFAMLFGCALVMLGVRLWHLALEMAKA